MCQSCVEIDKRVERLRELLRSTTDPAEIERIKRLIAALYMDRVRLHQNPEQVGRLSWRPPARLESRLRCPRCGNRRMAVMYEPPPPTRMASA
jgi:hypothetical protein